MVTSYCLQVEGHQELNRPSLKTLQEGFWLETLLVGLSLEILQEGPWLENPLPGLLLLQGSFLPLNLLPKAFLVHHCSYQ